MHLYPIFNKHIHRQLIKIFQVNLISVLNVCISKNERVVSFNSLIHVQMTMVIKTILYELYYLNFEECK